MRVSESNERAGHPVQKRGATTRYLNRPPVTPIPAPPGLATKTKPPRREQIMSSAQTELQRLLSLPLVDIHSRNALAVLYGQCEAPSVFACFAVEHIARRARSTLHSHIRKLLEGCTCADCRAYAQERPDLGFRRGPRPDTAHELEVPEQAVFESGAVNDEAKRWICDFLLFRASFICLIVLYLLCREECGQLLIPFPGVPHSTVQEEAGNEVVGGRWRVVSRDC